MSAERVPTLDLEGYAQDREAFVQRLGEAYGTLGFCAVRNHGIEADTIADAYAAFRRFFALPAAVKRRYELSGGGGLRGYTGFGVETARDSVHPDLKEFWQIGRDLPPGHPHAALLPANVWPAEIPEFRSAGERLYRALDGLGRRLLRAMALYLGREERYFDDKVNLGNSVLRPIHYPPIEDPATASVRSGQHEDINLITLLIGADGPGLEILTRSGQWLPVTAEPGAIVCNIGDMMQRLTNHVFRSTTHRVVNPPGELSRRSRYSIPFFLHPNADFVIETLPECVSADNPDRYPEPLPSQEYLRQRLVEIGLLPGRRPTEARPDGRGAQGSRPRRPRAPASARRR